MTGHGVAAEERQEHANCIGIDAAKVIHWTTGIDESGRIDLDRAVENTANCACESDPRDARTIAELVRTRNLRPILPDADTVVELSLEVGRRRDLVFG